MVLRAPSLRRHQRRQVSTKLYAKDARTHGCPGSRWRVVLVPAPAEEHSAQDYAEIERADTRRLGSGAPDQAVCLACLTRRANLSPATGSPASAWRPTCMAWEKHRGAMCCRICLRKPFPDFRRRQSRPTRKQKTKARSRCRFRASINVVDFAHAASAPSFWLGGEAEVRTALGFANFACQRRNQRLRRDCFSLDPADPVADQAGLPDLDPADPVADRAGLPDLDPADPVADRAGSPSLDPADPVADQAGSPDLDPADPVADQAGSPSLDPADPVADQAGSPLCCPEALRPQRP
jgi:hypothetical protein